MRDLVLDIVRRYVDDRCRKSGDANVLCRCPFHKGGQETKPSFSVNIEMGVFNCFTCHESGTIPTLLTMMGVPAQTVDRECKDLRQGIKANLEARNIRRQKEMHSRDPFRAHTIISEALISGFRWCPVQLVQLGFQSEWLQYLQVGVDRKNQRITYPIRDIYGNLAGFSGGATMAGQHPKYKVYRQTWKDLDGRVIPSDYGTWFEEEYPRYEFRNHDYLWNYDRVYPRLLFGKEVQQLIIVEGFKACIWLLQHGYRNTVALMGSSLSQKQLQLLLRVDAEILLFLDNNEAGREGTVKIGSKLQQAVPAVRVIEYPQGADKECQPDDLDHSYLRRSIESATPYRFWNRKEKRKTS